MKNRLFTLMLCSILGVACLGVTACGSSGSSNGKAPTAAEEALAKADDATVQDDEPGDAADDNQSGAISSDDPTGNWEVVGVSNDGGDNFDVVGSSAFTVKSDGTAVLSVKGESDVNLKWELDEYDGEGYFYYFYKGSSSVPAYICYIYDDSADSTVLGTVQDDLSTIYAIRR